MKKLILLFLFLPVFTFAQVGSKIVLFKQSLTDTLLNLRWYNNDLYFKTSADSILFNKPTNISASASVDTSTGDSKIATQYKVRTTDSVGTLVSGAIGSGFTAIDTARTNAVGNVTAGTGIDVVTEGKTKLIKSELRLMVIKWNQSGTNPPSWDVLYNTTGYTISDSIYHSPGVYEFTFSGDILDESYSITTQIQPNNGSDITSGTQPYIITVQKWAATRLFFSVYDVINGYIDDAVQSPYDALIRIELY